MTWTYTQDPAARSIDAVRFLIGDTLSTDPQLSDEEIAWLLSQNGSSANQAAVAGCRTLIAKYARLVDTQVDDVRESASQAHKNYVTLLSQLQAQMTLSAMPFAGGISIAQKQTAEEDTDRVTPIFTRDMHVVSPSAAFNSEDDS